MLELLSGMIRKRRPFTTLLLGAAVASFGVGIFASNARRDNAAARAFESRPPAGSLASESSPHPNPSHPALEPDVRSRTSAGAATIPVLTTMRALLPRWYMPDEWEVAAGGSGIQPSARYGPVESAESQSRELSTVGAMRPTGGTTAVPALAQSDSSRWFLLIPVALLLLLWVVIQLSTKLFRMIQGRLRREPLMTAARSSNTELSEAMASRPGEQASVILGRSWIRRIPWDCFKLKPALAESDLAKLSASAVVLELSFTALILVIFSAPFLNFSRDRILTGNEFDVFAFLDYVMVNALRRFGAFPTWNFQLRTGQPLIGDPFMHMFNPISSIPVLLLGVVNGFKVAAFASLSLAAFGQWLLGRALGLNRPARIWGAILYALNGQAVSRFLQGEFLFTFGYAWIPLVFCGVLLSLRTRRPRYYLLAAASITFMFFSGNGYYTFYAATILGLLTLCTGFYFSRRRGPTWSFARVKPLLLIGALAIGLTAIQWLPTLELWQYVAKAGDPVLATSQPFLEVVKDYSLPSIDRVIPRLPPEEYYGYIGLFPLLAAPLAFVAFWQGWRRREIAALLALVVLTFTWICVRYTPFATIYSTTPVLIFLRYPSRVMVFGAMAILALAGLGMTWLMRTFSTLPRRDTPDGWFSPKSIYRILAAGLVLAMFLSAVDVFRANQKLVGTRERNHEADAALSWLASYDPGRSYIATLERTTGWHLAVVSSGQRYLDAWYGYDFFPPGENLQDRRPVEARPNYLVLPEESTPPIGDASAIGSVDHHVIYVLEDSLPFAFSVSDSVLSRAELGVLKQSEVTPLQSVETGPDEVTVQANLAGSGNTVVLMTSTFPGWRVYVDGQPGEIAALGNYLSVQGRPGTHEYTFRYESTSLRVGAIITSATVLLLLGWLLEDAYSHSKAGGDAHPAQPSPA